MDSSGRSREDDRREEDTDGKEESKDETEEDNWVLGDCIT